MSMTEIKIKKKVSSNKVTNNIISSKFNEFINIPHKIDVPNFFEIFEMFFKFVPKEGEKSLFNIYKQSKEHIEGDTDNIEEYKEQLLNEIDELEDILFAKEIPSIEEHPYYPNNTLLLSPAISEVQNIVDDNSQGLPIWIMQEGAKREFKNYDTFLTMKKILGHQIDIPNNEIAEKLTFSQLRKITTGDDINNDIDLNKKTNPGEIISTKIDDYVDFYIIKVTCLEGLEQEPPFTLDINDPSSTDIIGTPSSFISGLNYSKRRDACRIEFYRTDGLLTSRKINPGTTTNAFRIRAKKPTIHDPIISYPDTNILGLTDPNTGYLRIEYMNEKSSFGSNLPVSELQLSEQTNNTTEFSYYNNVSNPLGGIPLGGTPLETTYGSPSRIIYYNQPTQGEDKQNMNPNSSGGTTYGHRGSL